MRTSNVFLAIFCGGILFAINVSASEKSKVPILPLTSAAASATPCCLGNAAEDYNDGFDTTDFMNYGGICGVAFESSGVLVLNLPDSCSTFPYKGTRLKPVYQLCGDFDVQVDYVLAVWPAPVQWRDFFLAVFIGGNVFVIERLRYWSVGGCVPSEETYKSWYNNDANCASTMISTSDLQGKLRITRSGSTLQSYYWNGSSWVVARTETAPISPADFVIGNQSYPPGGNPTIFQSVRIDNLIIQSQSPANTDGDTIPDCRDNCPLVSNSNQSDVDLDTVGDSCDICPTYFNPLQEVIKPGDANASNDYSLGDAISIVNYVFNKPGCSPTPECWLSNLLCRGDWDGSNSVALSDVIRAVNHIFNKPGGPWTAIPVGACCVSPT